MIGRVGLAVLAVLAVAGCATRQPKRLMDLGEPVFALHVETASCGNLRVVDGARHYWTEKGCEGTTTGFVHRGRATEAQARAIAAAFEKLPHDAPCTGGAPAIHIFTSRVGFVQKTWRVCVPDERVPLPPAYAAVEAAFSTLP